MPFHGREQELEELSVWSAGEPGLELALLHGAGGNGKTRLAAELCRRMQRGGGIAGFLVADTAKDAIEALGEVTAPLLVVVDEGTRPARRGGGAARNARGAHRAKLRFVCCCSRGGQVSGGTSPSRDGLKKTRTRSSHGAPQRSDGLGPSITPLKRVNACLAPRLQPSPGAWAARCKSCRCQTSRSPCLTRSSSFTSPRCLCSRASGRSRMGVWLEMTCWRWALEREARYWADTAARPAACRPRPAVLERAVALATLTVADNERATPLPRLPAVPDLADASSGGESTRQWRAGCAISTRHQPGNHLQLKIADTAMVSGHWTPVFLG